MTGRQTYRLVLEYEADDVDEAGRIAAALLEIAPGYQRRYGLHIDHLTRLRHHDDR